MRNLVPKALLWALILSLLCVFSGCAAQSQDVSRETVHGAAATDSSSIDFRYFYRGFTPVSLDNRASMEAFQEIGIKLILDEDSWHDYMGKFCPGVPYYEEVDYSRECLLTSVVLGARPPYAIAKKRISLRVENGCFASEYDGNPSNWVYALNGDDTAHFYVEVMIINREDIPADIEGMIYHP